MLLLAIDTTLGACSAAIYDSGNNRLLSSRFEVMARGHAEAIAPMVASCFEEARVSLGDLSRIAVTSGPGTFTGVRIGLSLAHGMSMALGVPAVGVNTLLATAAPLLDAHASVLVFHAAGATGKFYAAFIARDMDSDAADRATRFADCDECVDMLGMTSVKFIGTGADAFLAAGHGAARRLSGHDLPMASRFAALAARLPASSQLPQPLYLREPDAKPAADAHVLRPAETGDLATLSEIHCSAFNPGWTEESIRLSLSLPGAGAWVATRHGMVRSFVQYQIAANEAEIITLCTAKQFRNQGLARMLLAALMDDLRRRGIKKLFLEVAASNSAARALYSTAGFTETGKRRDYYARGGNAREDAIVMVRILG